MVMAEYWLTLDIGQANIGQKISKKDFRINVSEGRLRNFGQEDDIQIASDFRIHNLTMG
jgi:hypothetical protein